MQKVVILKSSQSKKIELQLKESNHNHELFVFFVGKGQEEFKLETLSEHISENTRSNTFVRGVLFDQAKAMIEGLIRIGKKANGSNAFLDQKVILIGEKAHADVRPELEILTDDVKASHAASVGQLDQEQLFYLCSRGLTRKQATGELVEGFFQNIIDKIKDKDKIKINELVAN